MPSRRSFLTTMAAGLGTAALRPGFIHAAAPEVKTALGAPVGLQLYSLRVDLPKNVAGTLARVRELGIVEVESAGLAGLDAAGFRAALDKAGLRCQGAHIGLERLEQDAAGAFKEAKALGARHVTTAWIPHEKGKFSREVVMKTAEAFNRFGKEAKAEGLRYSYHCHGYEFVPSPEGTLFDTLAKNTDPALLGFEIDVFWAKAGGADPAALIAAHPGRVPLLHVKDMEKGLSYPAGTSGAPDDTNVAVGSGQIDWPAVFRAAQASRTEIYYLEDESKRVWDQLPKSLEYLKNLKA
jgi:sugar phosphate isomerase/epimerase